MREDYLPFISMPRCLDANLFETRRSFEHFREVNHANPKKTRGANRAIRMEHFKGISLIKCREVRVQAERALPLHTDGEPGFLRRDIRVRLTGSRLNVIVK